MSVIYKIGVRLAARQVLPEVERLEDSLNKSMAGFGFSEKIGITYVQDFSLSVARLLTEEEKSHFSKVITDTLSEQFDFAKMEYFTQCLDDSPPV